MEIKQNSEESIMAAKLIFQVPNKASEQIKKDRTIPKQIEKPIAFNSFYIKELRTNSNHIERNRKLPAPPSKP
jgi:hypothetical protein